MKDKLGFVVLMGALVGYASGCAGPNVNLVQPLGANDLLQKLRGEYSCVGISALDVSLAEVDSIEAINDAEERAIRSYTEHCPEGRKFKKVNCGVLYVRKSDFTPKEAKYWFRFNCEPFVPGRLNVAWSKDGHVFAYHSTARVRK